MILQEKKKLVISARSDREMNINVKKATWKRCVYDYLTALRGSHNLSHKENQVKIDVGN